MPGKSPELRIRRCHEVSLEYWMMPARATLGRRLVISLASRQAGESYPESGDAATKHRPRRTAYTHAQTISAFSGVKANVHAQALVASASRFSASSKLITFQIALRYWREQMSASASTRHAGHARPA
jgi:hypothetical protein